MEGKDLAPQVGFEPTTLRLTAEPVVTDSIATARLVDTEADSLWSEHGADKACALLAACANG
jgi:hypothetical protein